MPPQLASSSSNSKGTPALLLISLHLESTGFSATTSLLELAALALEVGGLAHVGARGGVGHTGSLSEVAVHGAGLDSTTQQNASLSLGRLHGQLVEGHALSSSPM